MNLATYFRNTLNRVQMRAVIIKYIHCTESTISISSETNSNFDEICQPSFLHGIHDCHVLNAVYDFELTQHSDLDLYILPSCAVFLHESQQ